MSPFELHALIAGRTYQALEPADFNGLEAHRFRIDRVILVADADHLRELAAEGLRIAVSRQSHQLRSVVEIEAEMAADHFPGEAERVRKVEGLDRFDLLADAFRQARAGRLADAVDSEDGGAIETRGEIGRGCVREMVGHEMEFLPQLPAKNPVGDIARLAEAQQEDLFGPRVRPPLGAKPGSANVRIERVGDVIDIVGGQAGIVQAEADCALRELMRVVDIRHLAVLDAAEALFLDSHDELAVDEQRGGRIVIHRVNSKDVHRFTSSAVPCTAIVFRTRG